MALTIVHVSHGLSDCGLCIKPFLDVSCQSSCGGPAFLKLRSRLHQCFDQRCLLRVADVDRDLHVRALKRFHEFAYSHCRTSCVPRVEYRVPHLFQLRVLTSGVWPCRQSLQHRLANVNVRRSQLVFFWFFSFGFREVRISSLLHGCRHDVVFFDDERVHDSACQLSQSHVLHQDAAHDGGRDVLIPFSPPVSVVSSLLSPRTYPWTTMALVNSFFLTLGKMLKCDTMCVCNSSIDCSCLSQNGQVILSGVRTSVVYTLPPM